MSSGDGDLVASHCASLITTFQRLARDLSLPQIDQELYTDLFLRPLEEQQCRDRDDFAASSTSQPASSASDMQAEALVSLGGSELVVKALKTHEQLTLQVLQAIALRENVIARMWACCDTYDERCASASEEARFTFLHLLQEHQLVTLLTVEAVFEWREVLTRPYPFLMRNGDNYLTSIVSDCAAFDGQALVRSLTSVRLRQDPLCAKVDLKRMQRHLEATRRSRLITTGAMWSVGLQPLQPLPSRTRSASAGGSRGSSLATHKRNSSGVSPASATKGMAGSGKPPSAGSANPLRRPRDRRYSHLYEGTPDDFVRQLALLSAALSDRRHQKDVATSQLSTPAAAPSSSSKSSATRRFSAPHPPPRSDVAESRQKQHRLLTAARVLAKEATLQRRVVEELYELAYAKERFVPLLDIPQLFHEAPAPPTQKSRSKGDSHDPADSWPLERSQWTTYAAAASRVDRLGCMSTAREALQAANLLPAWQRRMGRRASDSSAIDPNHSKSSLLSASGPRHGLYTPHKPGHLNTAAAATTKSPSYSDSFEHTSTASASASAAVADSRQPVRVPSASSSLTTSSERSSSSSSSSKHASAIKGDTSAAQEESGMQPAAPAAEGYSSSDFESESAASTASDSPRAPSSDKKADNDQHDHSTSKLTSEVSAEKHAISGAVAVKPMTPKVSASSSFSSTSSSGAAGSQLPSLDELREQLLAEHRTNSRSQSYVQ